MVNPPFYWPLEGVSFLIYAGAISILILRLSRLWIRLEKINFRWVMLDGAGQLTGVVICDMRVLAVMTVGPYPYRGRSSSVIKLSFCCLLEIPIVAVVTGRPIVVRLNP